MAGELRLRVIMELRKRLGSLIFIAFLEVGDCQLGKEIINQLLITFKEKDADKQLGLATFKAITS